MKTSISFLKSNKSLKETIVELDNTNTDYIHVDIMDGKFVANTSITIDDVLTNLSNTNKRLDIHLMVEEPVPYIEAFKNLNVEYITVHTELKQSKIELINLIHSYNIKAGLAINPDTKINDVYSYLGIVDYIIVMGVYPGAGGQKLILETIDKIKELKNIRESLNYNYQISIDGGINQETMQLASDADILISGSFVCMSDDYQKNINELKNVI